MIILKSLFYNFMLSIASANLRLMGIAPSN